MGDVDYKDIFEESQCFKVITCKFMHGYTKNIVSYLKIINLFTRDTSGLCCVQMIC